MQVVEDVDAAAERDALVDHAQLAMQPAPARRPQHAELADGREHPPVHACLDEALAPRGRNRAAAETVHDHAHVDAPARSALQRPRHLVAGAGEIEDVGLEQHLALRAIDGGDQGGKEAAAAFQQLQVVTGAQGGDRVRHAGFPPRA